MKCRIKNAQFNWTNPFGKMSKWHLEETHGMMRLIHNMACVTMINHSSNLAVTNSIYTCRCRTVYHIHEFICSIYYLMIIKYQTRRQNMQKWNSATPRGKFQFSNKYLIYSHWKKLVYNLGELGWKLEFSVNSPKPQTNLCRCRTLPIYSAYLTRIFAISMYNISTLFVTYLFANMFRVFP